MELVARRIGVSDFALLCDGAQFGRLADCEACHIYEGEDEDAINDLFEGGMTVRERLAAVRSYREASVAREASEYAAEAYAEGAWLRAAEDDPEARAEMEAEL